MIKVRHGLWSILLFAVVFLSACGGGGGGTSTKTTFSSVDSFIKSSSFQSSSVWSSSVQWSSEQSSFSRSSAPTASSVSSSSQSSFAELGYSKQAIFDDWFYEVTGYPNGFNFFLYVPVSYQQKTEMNYPLVIVLHGDNGYKEVRPKLTTYPLPTGVFNSFLLDSGN